MAGANYVLDKAYKLDGAVRKFRVVVAGTDQDHVAEASVQGARVIGICQEEISAADATAGRAVAVRWFGSSHAIAGAAISVFAELMTDNQGRVITATGTNRVIGIANNPAAAAGDRITVTLAGPAAQRIA